MSNLDETIQKLFDQLQERKKKVAELQKVTKTSWKTKGVYNVPFSNSAINIQTLSREEIPTAIGLIFWYDQVQEAGKNLLSGAVFNPDSIHWKNDYAEDCKKRLATIDLKEEEIKLKDLEARLNQVLSPEIRRKMEIEAIAKELGE